MFRRGIVSEVNFETHQVRVKYPDREDVESPWLDVIVRDSQDDKEYSLPSLGAQVWTALEENAETGACLGAIYSAGADATEEPRNADVRHWKFDGGAVFKFDRSANTLTIELPDGGDFELLPDGLLKVAGAADFVALAGLVDTNFANIVSAINAFVTAFNAHIHPTGVGPSGPPPPAPSASDQESVACSKTKTS